MRSSKCVGVHFFFKLVPFLANFANFPVIDQFICWSSFDISPVNQTRQFENYDPRFTNLNIKYIEGIKIVCWIFQPCSTNYLLWPINTNSYFRLLRFKVACERFMKFNRKCIGDIKISALLLLSYHTLCGD